MTSPFIAYAISCVWVSIGTDNKPWAHLKAVAYSKNGHAEFKDCWIDVGGLWIIDRVWRSRENDTFGAVRRDWAKVQVLTSRFEGQFTHFDSARHELRVDIVFSTSAGDEMAVLEGVAQGKSIKSEATEGWDDLRSEIENEDCVKLVVDFCHGCCKEKLMKIEIDVRDLSHA